MRPSAHRPGVQGYGQKWIQLFGTAINTDGSLNTLKCKQHITTSEIHLYVETCRWQRVEQSYEMIQ